MNVIGFIISINWEPGTPSGPIEEDLGLGGAFFVTSIMGAGLVASGWEPMRTAISRRKWQREAFLREAHQFEATVRGAHAQLIDRVQQAEENAAEMDAVAKDLEAALTAIKERAQASTPEP